MKRIKPFLKWLPEIYFLFFAVLYGAELFFYEERVNRSPVINYVGIILAIILIVQFFIKNRIIGLIISGIFSLLFLYLILAFVSDLVDITVFDHKALEFLIGGTLTIGITLTMSFSMFIKYYKRRF